MRNCFVFFLCCCLLLWAWDARAHFGMIIPSQSTVMTPKEAALSLSLKFWHPFANTGMPMEKPVSFKVFHDAAATDLLPSLQESKERGMRVFTGAYTIKEPGLYAFVMEPAPYFEKEEDCFIIHYTKVYVDAFGDDEGWDKPLGLKTEIVPLVRPNALYAGNVFQGQVLIDGKPSAHAQVEVEWYPGPDAKGAAPYESMITQTVKADSNGVFTYAAPASGWWGFAALHTAAEKIRHEKTEKDVELGAVLWVRFLPWQGAAPLRAK